MTVFRIQRRTNGRRTGSLPWFSVPIQDLLACKDSSSHHRCVYGVTRLRHLEQQYSRRCLIVQSSKEYQVCLIGACMHILPAFTIKTLREVRNRRCLRELRKTYEYNKNIDRNMFFFSKESRTRGHDVKLVKDQCRLDIRKYSFSQRTVNEWNRLSTDCITASSVNMFKNRLDTYLMRAGYT